MRPTPGQYSDSPGTVTSGAFGQPGDQALPQDLLAMLVALDRSKRGMR